MSQNTEEIPVIIGIEGELDGRRWMLHSSLVFGRNDNCDVTIPNRQVSRRHAIIDLTPNGIILEDLHSKNGTHHNGKSITEPVTLSDGDLIHIALAQKFVFISADATLPLDPDDKLDEVEVTKGRLRLEVRSRRVWIGDIEILPPLSASQFRLLKTLYQNQGQLVSRQEVMSRVWGQEEAVGISEQALDALVRRLRERLFNVDPTHAYVVTVRGHGLRLENPAD